MYVHQNFGGFQFVWKRSECADKKEELIFIYCPERKEFLVHKDGWVPLQTMFAKLLAGGTGSKEYRAALVLKAFTDLHNEFIQTVTPKHKVDDIVMEVGYSNSGRTYKSVRVLAITDIRRTVACVSDGTSVVNIDTQYQVEDTKTGEISIRSEGSLMSLEELPDGQSEDRIFKELKATLRRLGTGAFGASLIFKGKAYRF